MLVHCLVQMHNRIKELENTAGEFAQQLNIDFKPRQFDAIVQQTLKKHVPALRGDNSDDVSTNIIEKINEVASKYDEHTSPVKEKRSRLVSTGPAMPSAKARPMSVNLANSAPQTLQKIFDEPQKDKSESRSRRGSKTGKLKRTSTEMTGSSKIESNVDQPTKELMTFISPRSLAFAKASPQSFASTLFDSPRSRKLSSHRDEESFKFNTISSATLSKDTLDELRNADKPELPPKPARRKRSGSSSSDSKKKKKAPTPPPKVQMKVGDESESKTGEVKEQSDLDKSQNEEKSQADNAKKDFLGPPTEYFRDRFRSKSRSRSLNNIVIVNSPRKMDLVAEDDEDQAKKKTEKSLDVSPASSMSNSIASALSDDKSTAPKGDSASNSEASAAQLKNENDTLDIAAP